MGKLSIMKEDFKMKNVRIGVGFVFCFIATIALFIFNNLVIIPNVEKNENITYYIIASNAFNKPGEFRKIDENGNLLSKKKVKIQDVTEFNFDKQNFIAGGHRFNNNIIIDENGNCKLFSLLNNPNHSGVTSINVNGNQIIAVMNGNVTDNTYKNLFVVQNKEEEILKKEIIDIYSSDSLIKENVAYIVGGYLSVQEGHIWSSKVMKIDLNSYEIEEKIYDKNTEYIKIMILDDKLYCLGATINEMKSNIDILDPKTLERMDSFSFDKEIKAIFTIDNSLYCVIDNEIREIKNGILLDKEYTLPSGTYVDNYLSDNASAYIYCRNENIYKENGKFNMGYLVKYDKKSKAIKETPVLLEGKRYDRIIFFPTEYIKNKLKHVNPMVKLVK